MRGRRRLVAFVALVAAVCTIATIRPLAAQVAEPAGATAPTTSVIGVVTDSISGSFVAGAQITVAGTELATSTDPRGRFALRVPLGSRRLIVVRSSYEDLEAVVLVTDPMGGLLLKLVPDPSASPDSVDVSGVVADASSGAPIVGALVQFAPPSGPRAMTTLDGRFTVRSAPTGRQTVTVSRYGYRAREEQIEVRVGMRDPSIQLTPDPIQLEALTVTGSGKADLRGKVLDLLTDQPVANASLMLTRDGFTRVGRVQASDTSGDFALDDVQFGGYLLKVERIGYLPQYVGFSHPQPGGVLVRLDPSPAMLAGVETVTRGLQTRTRGFANRSFEFTEKRIRDCAARSLEELTRRCGGDLTTGDFVYVDEVLYPPAPQSGPFKPDLAGYHPNDFYRIEIYVCPPKGTAPAPPPPPASGRGVPLPPPPPSTNMRHVETHFFTYAYIERLAGRPRDLVPPCS